MESTSPSTSAASENKSNWGCLLAGGLGCLVFIGMVAGLLVIGSIWYYQETVVSSPTTTYTDPPANLNTNTPVRTSLVDPDDISGAYQIIAYPKGDKELDSYPSVQANIEQPLIAPLPEGDYGFLWVGATLSNGYFVQVGMSTSDEVDADGNMQWNYFWEMWDDQDNYLEGEQALMSNYDWDENAVNTFTATCQDPTSGEWEFWVNEVVIGTTNTIDCDMSLSGASLTWEVVTPKTPSDPLPEFGPFQLSALQYWNGEDWKDVHSATLGYGYGLIQEGTSLDQASVCPPYGVAAGSDGFTAGSGLPCLASGEVLWSQ